MNISNYTTYDEIRAVLGVSEEEISNTDLALPVWGTALEMKFEEISDLILTTYDTVSNISESSRTPNQQKFYILTRFYAAYAVGEELLATQPMFSFKRVTDGKAEAERFDKWEDVKSGVIKGASVAKKRLKLALGLLGVGYSAPSEVILVPIVSTGIATDPVTGV